MCGVTSPLKGWRLWSQEEECPNWAVCFSFFFYFFFSHLFPELESQQLKPRPGEVGVTLSPRSRQNFPQDVKEQREKWTDSRSTSTSSHPSIYLIFCHRDIRVCAARQHSWQSWMKIPTSAYVLWRTTNAKRGFLSSPVLPMCTGRDFCWSLPRYRFVISGE